MKKFENNSAALNLIRSDFIGLKICYPNGKIPKTIIPVLTTFPLSANHSTAAPYIPPSLRNTASSFPSCFAPAVVNSYPCAANVPNRAHTYFWNLPKTPPKRPNKSLRKKSVTTSQPRQSLTLSESQNVYTENTDFSAWQAWQQAVICAAYPSKQGKKANGNHYGIA